MTKQAPENVTLVAYRTIWIEVSWDLMWKAKKGLPLMLLQLAVLRPWRGRFPPSSSQSWSSSNCHRKAHSTAAQPLRYITIPHNITRSACLIATKKQHACKRHGHAVQFWNPLIVELRFRNQNKDTVLPLHCHRKKRNLDASWLQRTNYCPCLWSDGILNRECCCLQVSRC